MAEEQPVTAKPRNDSWIQERINNREEKRGCGIGLYIREGLKYKRRDDITTKRSTIEHMRLHISEKDSFLLAVF